MNVRRIGAALLAVVLAAVTGASAGAPAASAGVPDLQAFLDERDWTRVSNLNAGPAFFLAVSGAQQHNGAPIIQWHESRRPNGQPAFEQQWRFVYHTQNRVTVRNAGTPDWKAMTVRGASKAYGAGIVQQPYTVVAEQVWVFEWYEAPQIFKLINVNSGQCLAMPQSSAVAGRQAVQWPCNDNSDQLWVFYD
jgi:hypothetical protein